MANSVKSFAPTQSENVRKHRKESTFRRQLSLVNLGDGEEVASIRFYGKGERAYCCAWFGRSADHARGSGFAGGGGYHKDSAAMHDALRAAGWVLEHDIDGRGEEAEREALEAIARWLWHGPRFKIISAHP